VPSFLLFFTVAIVIIDVAYYILILNAQLGLKGSVKKVSVILYGTFVVLSIALYSFLTNNSAYSILIAAALLVIYAGIFTESKWVFKLFWVGFPVILLFGIEILALSALPIVYPDISVLGLTSPEMHYYIATGISKLILIGLLYLLTRVKLHLEQFGYYILAPLAAASILSIFFMVSLYESVFAGGDTVFSFRASLVLLAINLIIVWLIAIINKKNTQQLEHGLQAQKQALRIKNYEQLFATHEKFKEYQDIIDQIMVKLWSVLKEDYNFTSKELRMQKCNMILHEINQLRQNSNLMFCTEDEILNVVLSTKDDLAKKKGIKINAKLDISLEQSYDSGIVGGILIAMLDNAIETVDSIEDIEEDDGKEIDVSIQIEDGVCEIVIENPADKMIELQELMEHQGAALRIAEELAARCSGALTTVCEEYYFTAKVEIPLPMGEFEIQPAGALEKKKA